MIPIDVANKDGRAHFEHGTGPLEFGRGPRREVPRWTILDSHVSKDQLRIEALSCDRVRLENLSRRVPVSLANGLIVGPGEVRDLDLPLRCTVGETLIEIGPTDQGQEVDESSLRTIAPPIQSTFSTSPFALPGLEEGPTTESLARWLETVVAVQRAAASSSEFYQQTARAVVELIGLDCGLVLLRDREDWDVVARHSSEAICRTEFSRAILQHVCQERRTFYQALMGGSATASLVGVSAVVAAPIFADLGDRIVGAVYGSRFLKAGGSAVAIRPLEAQLVQVLAAAVGAGLARLTSETESARRLVQFEQFFSADLARALDRDPALLEGREREVTVLFGDIRGFSRIAERLEPRETCQIVGDLMEQFTARVHEQGGVVVDYVGDGLLAMWNAPVEQSQHTVLACRAALSMLAELPRVNARWRDRIGGSLGLGIGLNTGSALVGNTGSRSKLKYGPHGHTVNLASRVEGATKHLGVPILITGSTHDRLAGAFATRRLCRARVVGIAGAVDLYELYAPEAEPQWQARRDAFEAGLALYESGRWSEAWHKLYPLLVGPEDHNDLPTLSLLGRIIECLKAPPPTFDPVIELRTK